MNGYVDPAFGSFSSEGPYDVFEEACEVYQRNLEALGSKILQNQHEKGINFFRTTFDEGNKYVGYVSADGRNLHNTLCAMGIICDILKKYLNIDLTIKSSLDAELDGSFDFLYSSSASGTTRYVVDDLNKLTQLDGEMPCLLYVGDGDSMACKIAEKNPNIEVIVNQSKSKMSPQEGNKVIRPQGTEFEHWAYISPILWEIGALSDNGGYSSCKDAIHVLAQNASVLKGTDTNSLKEILRTYIDARHNEHNVVLAGGNRTYHIPSSLHVRLDQAGFKVETSKLEEDIPETPNGNIYMPHTLSGDNLVESAYTAHKSGLGVHQIIPSCATPDDLGEREYHVMQVPVIDCETDNISLLSNEDLQIIMACQNMLFFNDAKFAEACNRSGITARDLLEGHKPDFYMKNGA